MDTLKLLHISDLHIGAPFLFLGPRGGDQRAAIRDALARAASLARNEAYDALLIAGDLFDDAFDASDADVSFVAGCLADAACRVVILPGGHDCWAPGSVYQREIARFEAAPLVRVLRPGQAAIDFPELSLAAHGIALTTNLCPAGVFAALAPDPARRWNVALAHCSVAGVSGALDPGETAAPLTDLVPGFDYVALGHWHSYRVLREKDPLVAYSGSPEIVARDQRGAGFAASVTLSPEGSSIDRVPIGKRRVASVSVDCTALRGGEELVRRVLAAAPADPDLILEIALTGIVSGDAGVEPDRIPLDLAGRYFSVRLAGKGPGREISREELLAVPEETVAGAFVRRMLERIGRASGEEREILEEGLQLGVQLFKGRDLTG